MKLDEIKNMDSEEFIKLIEKNYAYMFKQEKSFFAKIAMLYGLYGYFTLSSALLLQINTKGEISSYIIPVIIYILGLSFPTVGGKIAKKNLKISRKKYKKELIKLKEELESLSDKDFELLCNVVKNVKKDDNNKTKIEDNNLLSIANSLMELNAISLLDEFTLNNTDEIDVVYKDDDSSLNNSKLIKK